MKKLLCDKVVESLKKDFGINMDRHTVRMLYPVCKINSKTRNIKQQLKYRFMWFFNGVKYDIGRTHGIVGDDWLAKQVASELYRREKNGDRIIGVYEVSDYIADTIALGEAINYINGFVDELSFTAGPADVWEEEISRQLFCGQIPTRVGNYTKNRIKNLFKGYKLRFSYQEYGPKQKVIVGVHGVRRKEA